MDISKAVERDVRAQLQTGESPLVVASLRIPKSFTTATSWFYIIIFVRLFDEINNFFKMKTLRRQFEDVGFPIARRTTVCVTEGRILLWKQSKYRMAHNFLGSLDRDRVQSSQVGRSTHVKWKFVAIKLREGVEIRFLMDHASANQLSNELNKTAHEKN